MTRKDKFYNADGSPKNIRVYDRPQFTDRYTVIYTRMNTIDPIFKGRVIGLGMSEHPFHPQGVGQHFDMDAAVTAKTHGKKISFFDLPPDCQKAVIQDYNEYWRIEA
jgi:hypothetical protein